MKTFFVGIVGMWLIVAAFIGCATNSQRTTFNTIASVEATASAALDAYDQAVISKKITTNSVPQVSEAFNALQQAATLAAAVDQSGTNALAPSALSAELTQFVTLISTLVPTK